jgi:hypothetical protein
MTYLRRDYERQQQAKLRRLEKAHERLQREQAQAQRYLQALEQAEQELSLPETIAAHRVPLKGRVTMEEIVFSMKHNWRFLDSGPIELRTLSWNLRMEAA